MFVASCLELKPSEPIRQLRQSSLPPESRNQAAPPSIAADRMGPTVDPLLNIHEPTQSASSKGISWSARRGEARSYKTKRHVTAGASGSAPEALVASPREAAVLHRAPGRSVRQELFCSSHRNGSEGAPLPPSGIPIP